MTSPNPNVPDGMLPAYDPRMARAAQLTESARNWLIVCAVGWFVGVMWVTGPLGWYQATQFIREFHSLGLAPPSEVTNLRLLGMITTVALLAMALVVGAIVAVVLVVGVGSGTFA